ncbi:uncharacterized protein TRIREDRAFT_102850 [Trichoderma reesei QM6a]|jgi:hypothetical protein|uniref:Predicted protein n=2 Tax=Hypocrea jecorina TaxID=51453 RepID=G0R8G1_HYPJQ|nr:uncharacterized protein TRIREDRAFT_102850 [Trichoderma reesei QM6a]EGR52873.1 predicted protein [Trichoderma reesei QM6a]ETS06664.1 hypothetical protein M419DRAFT_31965 [Trichoderma reesei RUT C-30]
MKTPTVGHALAMGLAVSFAAANPLSFPLPADNATCTTTSWVDLAPPAAVTSPTAVTVTKYSTVVYQHTAVDCGGCGHLQVATRVQDSLPLETVTSAGAATITRGYCAGQGFFFPMETGALMRRHFEMVDPLEYDANDGDSGVLIQGDDDDEDCVARVMEGPPYIDMGDTSVAFATTVTLTRTVNCGSCTKASPIPIHVSPPHLGTYKATMTIDAPYKTTQLVCGKTLPTDAAEANEKKKGKSKSKKHSKTKPPKKTKPTPKVTETWPPPLEVHTVYGKGRTTAECFYNYALYPDRLDHTRKIWTSTFTSVAHKKCDHCGLIWFTAPYDPPVPESVFTTTVFKKGRKTATAMACSD